MKKVICLVATAVLATSILAGCGNSSKPTDTKPKTEENSNKAAKSYTDGTYKASYDHIDGHGWKPQIEIQIKDKKISKVVFDYVNPEGKLKTQDENYNKAMKDKSKTSPAEYSPQLGDNLVKTQDIDKVDVVTGATHSSENFKALAKAALANAEKGVSTPAILAMNDTYTASEKDFDSHGWKGQVSITYKDGKIEKVEFDELNKEGKKKSEDEKYNSDMKAKSKISAKEAMDKLEEAAMTSGKADTVTGATGTSAKFKALYEEALKMRK
ncbi:FMN-binding protein [Clostridium sp. JNZ J1-5]